jgi:hypothetical protein
MVQIYNLDITLLDGVTHVLAKVQMRDDQFQALQSYFAFCAAGGYGCTAATLTVQENPISYESVKAMLANLDIQEMGAPALP